MWGRPAREATAVATPTAARLPPCITTHIGPWRSASGARSRPGTRALRARSPRRAAHAAPDLRTRRHRRPPPHDGESREPLPSNGRDVASGRDARVEHPQHARREPARDLGQRVGHCGKARRAQRCEPTARRCRPEGARDRRRKTTRSCCSTLGSVVNATPTSASPDSSSSGISEIGTAVNERNCNPYFCSSTGRHAGRSGHSGGPTKSSADATGARSLKVLTPSCCAVLADIAIALRSTARAYGSTEMPRVASRARKRTYPVRATVAVAASRSTNSSDDARYSGTTSTKPACSAGCTISREPRSKRRCTGDAARFDRLREQLAEQLDSRRSRTT